MKKNVKIYALAIAAMAAAGCTKENLPETSTPNTQNLTEFTITAGTEDGVLARSGFGEEYPAIEWNENDLISVIGTSTQNQQFKATSAGKSTEFNGLLDLSDETLYAVYPYDAAVTAGTTAELMDVTVPSVQYATANSFDPKAYVAVAKSTTKSFAFKAVGGFFKFRLEDAANVKSVTIVTNGQNVNIAGTAGVTFSEDGIPSHGVSGTWKSSTNTIKLVEAEGGHQFSENTDYFIATRANSCPNGVTFYIEYDNGDVYTTSTTKKIFSDGSRNKIAYMGVFGKSNFTLVNDLYTLYNMGYDIKVGDITVNSKDFGAAQYTELTEADTKDLTTTLKSGGVHFISATEGASFTINGYVDTGNNLIIINKNTDRKINYTHSANHTFNHNNTIFAMKGIDISLGTKYLINNSKAADGAGKIIFDDCKFSNVGTNIYYGSNKEVGMSLIQLQKCDVVTTIGVQLINLNTTKFMNGYQTIKCNDCTFSSGSLQDFVLINSASATQTGTAPTSVIEVKNCSFHNLRPNNSYINVPWCENMKFNKNLVSVYSLTKDGTMAAVNTDTSGLSVIDATDNYYYVKNFNEKTLKAVSSDTESVTSESSYPFNTTTFQVWATYAGFGATR